MAAKKRRSSRRAAAPRSGKIAESVVESGQKIWLAGLGAYERARKEGPKMFNLLVSQGQSLRGQAAAAADQALKSVRAQADATASQAAGKWDKLEQVFEDRVAKAVHKLGVMTGKDVDALARQVSDLNASVMSMMGRAQKPSAKKAAKRKATKKKRAVKSKAKK